MIVAGGKGARMNADLPKQFLPVGGKPVLMCTLEVFHEYDKDVEIILVLPENQFALWENLCEEHNFKIPHKVVAGGAERFYSVRNGLALVPCESLVAVHDGVRPFVSPDTIDRCFRLAREQGAAVPVVMPTDSLRVLSDNESKAVSRSDYRLVQTPQVFRSALLKRAYEQDFSPLFTDDASVVEAAGIAVCLVDGNRENIKITAPFDLLVAEAVVAGREYPQK